MQPSDNPYAAPGTKLTTAGPTEKYFGPASPLQRFLNYLIDFVGSGALYLLCVIVWAVLDHDSAAAMFDSQLIGTASTIVVTVLYYVALESTTGRTLGKVFTSTKVVGARGGKPALHQILVRSCARYIPFEAFTFLSGDSPGLHDKLSGTRVVRLTPTKLQRAMDEA